MMSSIAGRADAALASAPRSAASAQSRRPWVTDVMLVMMALIWGVNIPVVKYGTELVAPLAYNGIRVLLATLALFGIAALRQTRWPPARVALPLIGIGILGNGLYQVLFIEGIARTRAGSAALLLAATPAFVALIGWLRRTERTRLRGIGGIGLSIVGIGFIVYGGATSADDTGSMLGNLLILAGTICWAWFTVLLKPYTHEVDAIHLPALTMLGGVIPLLIVSAPSIATTSWTALPSGGYAAIIFSGLGALVIAYLFYYRGVRELGPTRTAMYGNLQPVIALLVAWVALAEVPTVWQGLGTLAIMTGLLFTRS